MVLGTLNQFGILSAFFFSWFYRCIRLAFHIQLPYSFLHLPYVEAAVRYTYQKDYCGNCSWYYSKNSQEVNSTASTQMMATTEATRIKEKNLPYHKHEEKSQDAPNTEDIVHQYPQHGEMNRQKALDLTNTDQPFHHSQSHPKKHQAEEP
ncbi:hypothetical protein JD844_018090 [Phrynosoma platyrhinos]|uniref:Selenoprotein P N-terminal domain-containing protein n=1 Tax=Phrynosoma platyrhinos TaxID=52577 RepID=A0ABQ7SMZ6_PHRPL|nr:hypothetical protein JD844_018090 [Phrynosoma platyrhinos]